MKRFVATVLVLAAACAATDEPEPRIALAPTAEGELPSAVLGTAPPLGGAAVQYVDGDTATVGYLAVPEGTGPFAALIIIHEWNGLVDRIREMADAFAREGYVTLAADLYQGRIGTNRSENMALVLETRQNQQGIIDNLDAAAAFLRARGDVTGKVASMGWCFGGGIALSYALGGEHHDATAIFYGALIDDPEELRALDHEVYGTFGRLDGSPSPESVEAFQAALNEVGIANDLHIYDAVDHGFWLRVDADPDVRTAPATDAWSRLKAYLRRTLG